MVLNDNNFEQEVLKFEGPVLVDFFATWCGPCQMLAPIIDELDNEVKDKAVRVFKVDVDASPLSAEKYGIMSVPTLIFFKKGEVVEVLNGVQGKESLKQKLMSLI